MMRDRERRALMLMFVASLLWPILEHTGVSLMPRHHPIQVVFLRYAAHLLLLMAVVVPMTGVSALRTRRPAVQILRGLFMFGMPMCYVLGREYGDGRWVWSMFWTMPLASIIAGVVLLRERLYAGAVIAALAGAAGGIAIMGGEFGPFGTLFGVAMGGTVAGYMVLSRVLRDESLPASLFYTAVGAGLPTALLVWRVWTPVLASEILTIAMVGALSLLILSAFDLSLEAGPVSLAVPMLALVPAWEALLAVSATHALPGPRQLAGIAVIVVGFGMLLVMRIAGARAAAGERGWL
jgi:drug/metabolite transporter (DMT)-like permease